jgi:ribonuclease Z
MSNRELFVLGTGSQAPTRYRNHNGYYLRFDGEGFLFDPGEGTQRQMAFARVSASSITRICITHFHGDHCLGLPGIIQRLSLDGVTRPVPVYHPASGSVYLDRLSHASIFDDGTDIVPVPLVAGGVIGETETLVISTLPLRHSVDSWGYRVAERPRRNLDPVRLAAAGVEGPAVGELLRRGSVEAAGRRVELDEMSVETPGQVVAFVMDTAMCDEAVELATGADLLVCESTFLDEHQHLATAYGHLTARDAARIAERAGVRRLLLTHFSQRVPDVEPFVREAREVFADTIAAVDGLHVSLPPRRRPARP